MRVSLGLWLICQAQRLNWVWLVRLGAKVGGEAMLSMLRDERDLQMLQVMKEPRGYA